MIALRVSLGRMSYDEALGIQRSAHARRASGEIPDVVFSVEHDPVFTRGRSARPTSFRAAEPAIAAAGIAIRDAERGGDVTYHGPGQLVVYPILDLRGWNRDVKAHVRRLEEAAIRTLARYGVLAFRRDRLPGVWTDQGKIASVGVAVRRWVTMHGLALNVDVNAEHFAMIDPCGLPVRAVSLCEALTSPVALADVEAEFIRVYGGILGVAWQEVDGSRFREGTHA